MLISRIALPVVLAVLAAAPGPTQSPKPRPTKGVTPEQARFFESRVRPVLYANCFGCHGEKEQKGGLRLDNLEGLMKGRLDGSVVIPGDPEKSRLILAVRYTGKIQMPPSGKLTPAEISDLVEWVKMGAPWPEAATASRQSSMTDPRSSAAKKWWSFQPVRAPALPKVKNASWARSPIDVFILAKLESAGLKPAPLADKRTLIRRAYFDLIGLPPLPEEVETFVQDSSPEAFAKVVDHLLASPHYGERWGRHWLDVARYADSNGLDENVAFANAWRYRDYVIDALNKDKPYDQFIVEQIAGDLVPSDSLAVQHEHLTATGFLQLGAKVLAESDKPKMVMDIIDEQIEATSKAFLGMTVSCARCHNHKFDPIPTQDYYALAGIFKSTKTMSSLATVAMWNERPLTDPELDEQQKASEARLKPLRTAVEEAKKLGDSGKDQLKKAEGALHAEEAKAPKIPHVMAVEDSKAENCRVHIRGNTQTLGEEVPRRFLTVLSGDRQTAIDATRSGRLELAQWIASPTNPLTPRVLVNRVWQGHFGEGLVATSDNFGFIGERPSNPELLDWLAAVVVENEKNQKNEENEKSPHSSGCGWSLKRLHRLIMLSSAYQMSDAPDSKAQQIDPGNRLLWRMNRRRMEAEPLRDFMLAISGKLDPKMGGSLLTTGNHDYVTNDQSGNGARYNNPRRSIYLPIIRNALFDMFQAFDFGDPTMVNAKRATTTVAPQALWAMNSPFAREQAAGFAESVLKQSSDDSDRIRMAYMNAFARPPTPKEIQQGDAFLAQFSQRLAAKEPDAEKRRVASWSVFCQILFASNEFVYID